MVGETLPGTAVDDADGRDRIICHVDMDCFYASCERLRHPDLVDEPVVVGMGYEPGETAGAVATASYEARAFGVESAMPISEALQLLPRRAAADPADPEAPDPAETGRYLPVDLEFYNDVASDVKAILHDVADTVREVSIDEAYLDVTDRTAWDVVGDSDADTTGVSGAASAADPTTSAADPTAPPDDDPPANPLPSTAAGPADDRTLAEGYARYINDRTQREAGVPASVGVAPNMSTAKVASDADKPDGLVVVPPGTVAEFLEPLPTTDLHGVGPVTEQTLADLGIETAGDLAAADPDQLADAFGDRGRELYHRARGIDDREVTPRGVPKSLSRESSLSPTADTATKQETVSALAADVARRARERGCLYQTIGIKAVEPPFDVNTRARSLSGPVDDPDLVASVALDLLREFADDRVRKLGVRVSNLDFAAGDQATLTGFDGTEAAEDDDGQPDTNRPAGTDSQTATDSRPDTSGCGVGDTAVDGRSDERRTLTDWIDPEPSATASGDTDTNRTSRPRDGQSSLDDWG